MYDSCALMMIVKLECNYKLQWGEWKGARAGPVLMSSLSLPLSRHWTRMSTAIASVTVWLIRVIATTLSHLLVYRRCIPSLLHLPHPPPSPPRLNARPSHLPSHIDKSIIGKLRWPAILHDPVIEWFDWSVTIMPSNELIGQLRSCHRMIWLVVATRVIGEPPQWDRE